MNNKLKQALEKVTPEIQMAYAAGFIPTDLVLALSELTTFEQNHLLYEADPDDPNHSLSVGLFSETGEKITPSPERAPFIQAVIDIFLADQAEDRILRRREYQAKKN